MMTKEAEHPIPMGEISLCYARNLSRWKRFLGEFGERVAVILENDAQRFSLKSRIKTFESLSEKLSFLSRRQPEGAAVIKDLIGLRIVVPFQEGVEQVIALLLQHFDIVE